MLFQPTNITPSTLSGLSNSTVDINNGLTVSWQVNGNSAMVAFQLDIYAMDATSTLLYSTGKRTDGCPFYGVNYDGSIDFFEFFIGANLLGALSNGNQYKIVITQYWSDADFVELTSAAAFNTRTTPTLEISAIPSPLQSKSYTFSAIYAQAQSDPLNSVRWEIAQAEMLDEPLFDDTIYGTPELRVDYDGFFTGTNYSIRCTVETANGVTVTTGWVNFYVEYETSEVFGVLDVRCDPMKRGVIMEWPEFQSSTGVPSGEYQVINGTLELPYGSSVIWDTVNGAPMYFEQPNSFIWSGIITGVGEIVSLLGADGTEKGSIRVQTSNYYLMCFINGLGSVFPPISAPPGSYATIIGRAGRIDYFAWVPSGGLVPKSGLYPSEGLYPKESTDFTEESLVSMFSPKETFDFTSIELKGPQICRYFQVIKGTLTDAEIESTYKNREYVPQYDSRTYFLTTFSDGILGGGNVLTPVAITGITIYRLQEGESTLRRIGEFETTETTATDCTAASQKTYTYYMFATGEDSYVAEPMLSEKITPILWDWVVLSCVEGSDPNIYELEKAYVFKGNVVSGSVTNNNDPIVSKTFTRYPNVQNSSSLYMGGILSSLIGTIKYDGEQMGYRDTNELRDEIYELGTTRNTLFLKNRRGDVLMIRVSGAISMDTMDKTRVQAQTVTLPWCEIGDATGKSVILREEKV